MTAVTPPGTSQLFDRLAGQGLAQNRAMLDAGYTPSVLRHREGDVEALARRLAPHIAKDGPGGFVRLVGPAGCGKSSVVRVLNGELRQAEVASVVLDGRAYNTAYRVLAALTNHFIANPLERVPFTGLPLHLVASKLEMLLSASVRRVVVWLDHFDEIPADHASGVLTHLAGPASFGLVSVVLVSRDQHLPNVTDYGIRATLQAPAVRLEPYDAEELIGLLDERIQATLPRRESLLADRIVDRLGKDLNAVRAFTILREAVEHAERRNAASVAFADVDAASESLARARTLEAAERLHIATRHVLEVLRRMLPAGGSWTSGEAYAAYTTYCQAQDVERVTLRRFADLLRDLERAELVAAPVGSLGRYGRTRKISMSEQTRQLLKGWNPLHSKS